MKTVLSLLICVALWGSTYASSFDPGDIVTMRVVEAPTNRGSKIVITYKSGEQNVIELGGGGQTFEEKSATVNKTLNEIADKGYKLTGVASGNYGAHITTYVFVKE